ncbi:MAG: glycoside hydrolase N-terminal domain-containing protein [Armatimonadetes bacterium]|nr:glycoside hydrolase N-terminal domain-containing protein [Armatimonadota bacterium]
MKRSLVIWQLLLLAAVAASVSPACAGIGSAARFAFDRPSFISQYDFFFQRPTTRSDFGTPIGNGDVGVLQWGHPDETYFGINKADVWDRRFDKDQEAIPDVRCLEMMLDRMPDTLSTYLRESFSVPGKNRYPTPKRCGALIVHTPGAKDYTSYKDRLRLHSAVIDSEYETAVDKRSMRSFVYKDENLLVVKINFQNKRPLSREIELMRPQDGCRAGIRDAVGFVEGNDFGIEQHFPAHWRFLEDFHYVMRGRILGSSYSVKAQGYRAIASLPQTSNGELLVLVAVVSSRDNPNAKKAAKEILDRAEADRLEAVEKRHRKLWDDYWSKCMIDVPDPVIAHAWYAQVYLWNCNWKPGKYLPGLCGLWGWYDFAPWNGDYHTDQDIQFTQCGVFSGNHPELAQPFCDMFYKMLPLAQEQAKKYFFAKGARYPTATHEYASNLANAQYFWELSNSLFIAHVFWWYYDYTRDTDFLKMQGYPVMREVVRFFADYMKKDRNGTYYIYPSVPMECGEFTKNPLTDVSGLIRLLETTIKASEILGVDAKERAQWKHILKHMSPVPQGDGIFLRNEGADPKLFTLHALRMYPVFPAEIVGLDRGGPMLQTGKRTLHWTLGTGEDDVRGIAFWGHSRGWALVAAARLGEAEVTEKLAHVNAQSFLMENGIATTWDNWIGTAPLLDGLGLIPLGTNEMLMQGYSGTIRVFPATPPSWKTVRFSRLRSAGAHLVTSEKRDGEVAYIVIESLKGAPCSIISPWAGERVTVRDVKNSKVVFNGKGAKVLFNTRPGGVYLVERATNRASSYAVETPRSIPMSGPRVLAEGKYFGRIPRIDGTPIAGVEKGKIINLDAMVDGKILNPHCGQYDSPAAACADVVTKTDEPQNAAWFGLEYSQPKTIRSFKAFPAEICSVYHGGPQPQNLAEDYVLEYWDGSEWNEIPGTKTVGNTAFPVIHEFEPVTTTKVRMLITKVAESRDDGKPSGKFRPCMHEFETH